MAAAPGGRASTGRLRKALLWSPVALALAAAWLFAASRLWDSSTVPDDLHLPHIDPHAYFSAAFLELAKGLGMTTLAEGIETVEELTFLRERGCRLGQGFLFSKPVPPEEIIAYAFGGIPSVTALRAG